MMNSSFQIIYLNGPSSSGKTTLAKALQEKLDEPFLYIGLDSIPEMMPKKLITINDKKEETDSQGFSLSGTIDETGHPIRKVQIGPFGKKMLLTLRELVLTLAKMRHCIIIDDVASFRSPDINSWCKVLQDYKVLWIGMKAPLPILEEREKQRGDRIVGTSREQYLKVHDGVPYDLEFDTSCEPLEKIVQTIKIRLYQPTSDQCGT